MNFVFSVGWLHYPVFQNSNWKARGMFIWKNLCYPVVILSYIRFSYLPPWHWCTCHGQGFISPYPGHLRINLVNSQSLSYFEFEFAISSSDGFICLFFSFQNFLKNHWALHTWTDSHLPHSESTVVEYLFKTYVGFLNLVLDF